MTSSTNLSAYSQKFAIDTIKSTSCQTVSFSLEKSTSTKVVDTAEKHVQTCKAYYKTDRQTQVSARKIKLYSRQSQTPRNSVKSIRESIETTYPQSPLLSLNSDQFSRLITGNSKIPFTQNTILQSYKLQSSSGTSGYNLLRSELPYCFPSPSSIRTRDGKTRPGPRAGPGRAGPENPGPRALRAETGRNGFNDFFI